MIVSHKHKFIFIKTMKTAGTSIEAFLASYCEGRDIVTFLVPRMSSPAGSWGSIP